MPKACYSQEVLGLYWNLKNSFGIDKSNSTENASKDSIIHTGLLVELEDEHESVQDAAQLKPEDQNFRISGSSQLQVGCSSPMQSDQTLCSDWLSPVGERGVEKGTPPSSPT